MEDRPPGSIVGQRYRIISPLGAGGFATVYKALDLVLNRTVALKIFRPDASVDLRERLARQSGLPPDLARRANRSLALSEATMAGPLHHPNILRVVDYGTIGEQSFVATQYVEALSLARILADRTHLEPDYAIEIAVRVGTALIFAHWQEVIHRDIKPSNILISTDGNVFLADFGIAGPIGESTRTSSGAILGTPAFMSPEQAMGDPLDARSDVFSLAAVLFETLSGQSWFAADRRSMAPSEILQRIVREQPRSIRELVPEVSETVDLAISKALAKAPGDRFQTADDFVKALLPSKAVPLALLVVQPNAVQTKHLDDPTTASPEASSYRSGDRPSASDAAASRIDRSFGYERPAEARRDLTPLVVIAMLGLGILASFSVLTWHSTSSEAPYLTFLAVGALGAAGTWLMWRVWVRTTADAPAELAQGSVPQVSVQVGVRVDEDPTVSVPAYLPSSQERVREFASLWDALVRAAHESKERFSALTETLANGLMREAIGYRIADAIPYFKGTVGFMVEAPFLWIRQSRFPLLFVDYERSNPDLLTTVVHQLELARATEFFAVLVAIPRIATREREADELRRIVANSVYRLDFVVLDREHVASIVAHNSSRRLIEIILEQIDDLSVLSPYVVRGPVPEKMFFGRESEIKTVSQSIQRADYSIVGGRRIGKSSVLLRLKRLLGDDPRYRAIYMDCEARFDDRSFFEAFREFVELPAVCDPLEFRRAATALRDSSSPRQVVILLDEVDELLAFDAARERPAQLFRTLRSTSQEGLCRFVFSGSRTLDRHLRDPHSPFFNFCDVIRLKRLDEKSVTEIIRRPMRQLGIQMPDEERLIARLLDLTSSHPNIAQWVCDRLVASCVDRQITLSSLDDIANTSEFREHYTSTAWGDATPLEKLISLVMGGPEFTLTDVLGELAPLGVHNQKAVADSLEFLQLCALLDRRETAYRFGLTQFPRIVRESPDRADQIESLVDEARLQCS